MIAQLRYHNGSSKEIDFGKSARSPGDPIFMTVLGPLKTGHTTHPKLPVYQFRSSGERIFRGSHGPIYVYVEDVV